MSKRRHRARSGSSLVETLTGFFVLLPLALVAVDIATMMITAQQNEQLAESAARAASTQGDQQSAKDAAEDALSEFQTTSVVTGTSVEDVDYSIPLGRVIITTTMNVRLPVPFPNFANQVLKATATQPIVSTPAPR